jgi:hypothetical protein
LWWRLVVDGGSGPADEYVVLCRQCGQGNGADLGGLESADAHCLALARAAGSTRANWRAYLSTSAPGGEAGVNARDRIGEGPWQNVNGVIVANNLDELHSDANNLNKQTALTEKGELVSGRGDPVNNHDILTGSDPQGLYSTAGATRRAKTGKRGPRDRRSLAIMTAQG